MQSLDGFRTEQMHEKKKESLSFARLEKDWARPSGVKEIEGKRSAHTKIISSPTMCPSFPRNLGTSFASGPISTCLEIKVQNIGRANKEGSSQNGKLNLVKGKKDVARKRVNLSFPNAKAAPRINLPTTTNWYTNIKKKSRPTLMESLNFVPNPEMKRAINVDELIVDFLKVIKV